MKDSKYELIQVPRSLSERDRDHLDYLKSAIREIEREYMARVEPLQRRILEIEASYPPRIVLVPKAPSAQS